MKVEDTPFGPESASDRLVDAALREHARLGAAGSDEELVLRVLRETVHRESGRRRRSAERHSFALAAGAAAAVVGLVLVTLSSLRVERSADRRSDELSFVVSVVPDPGREALPVAATTVVAKSDPAIAALPPSAVRLEDLRITADRGRTSGGGFIYEGDVLVEMASLRIEAASVRLGASGGRGQLETALHADRVRVVRNEPSCVAEADRLSFDPATGRMVLTGVTRLETEAGLLAHFDPGDRLVLSGTGFTVESDR